MVKKDNLNISLTPSSNGVQADGDEKDMEKMVIVLDMQQRLT